MIRDIFSDLDKAGFGGNVREIAAEEDCRVLRLEGEGGEGFMTLYRVFDGVYLMYNDFHLRRCISEYQNAATVLCIDHCREGRIEHENSVGDRYYMEAGDLRIDKRVHHEGRVELPLSHYHGITIGFLQGIAEESLKREMPSLSLDIGAISERFCSNDKEFVVRANEPLNMLFTQLYNVKESIRKDYFKLKTVELLLMLSVLDTSESSEPRQYFPAKQTDKVKQIHALITGSLDRTYTVDELSERFGMPSASLRKVFKAVYGAPIYQYIKSYKMKAAASMLISESSATVADIAQRLGYDNASKFSAAFRDIMGVSPQEYRRI